MRKILCAVVSFVIVTTLSTAVLAAAYDANKIVEYANQLVKVMRTDIV